jgi:ABC-2 type transport system permease protein
MLAKGRIRPGFLLVFRREVDRYLRSPFLILLTVVMPLAITAVLASVFSAGLATRLPIAVVDLDNSELSRTIIRTVDATPDTAVALNVSDLAEGRQLIVSGKVHGLLMLPKNLQRDAFAGRRPEVVFFYNTQTLTSGNLTLRGVSAAVPSVAAGIRLSLRTSRGEPVEIAQSELQPIPVQVNPLFNPTLNYAHFLLAALVPAILQIVIATAMAYSVGRDAETPYRLRILRRLGGGLWPAVAGKMLPYTLIFLCVLGLADVLLFGWFGLPLRGDRLILLAGALLFIVAGQLIGIVLALVLPTITAVSVSTLITAPAFGFMGVGFPRLGMNAFSYYWGGAMPGTWYLVLRIDQTVRGTPPDLSIKPLLSLLAIVLVLLLVLFFRLETLRQRGDVALAMKEAAA